MASGTVGVADPLPEAEREGKIRLLAEAAQALLRNELPTQEQCIFLAGGLMAWLENGGDLLRKHWRVAGRAGSHRTAPNLWQQKLRYLPSPREEARKRAEIVRRLRESVSAKESET